MKTGKLLSRWLAVLCAALLIVSLFAIPAFADEEATTAETTETTTETASSGLSTQAIVWIIVAGVVVVVAVVLGLRFREKVAKFFRVYKSEIKKIVWLPWDQTKKSTLVVIVVLIICAAAICLVDYALGEGFLAFIKLF